MNRSKIPWCDHTFNPVTGCLHDCPYCYAKKLITRFSGDIRENLTHTDKYRIVDGIYVLDEQFHGPNGEIINYPFGFEPTFHRYRLKAIEQLKGGHNIFVGALADLFGKWVPDWVISEVIAATGNEMNNYIFLTKNPFRYTQLDLPDGDNFYYGVTLTSNKDVQSRSLIMMEIADRLRIFASIEPLHERLDRLSLTDISIYEWLIIGAETGNRKGKPAVQREWIDEICHWTKAPMFMKESVRALVDDFREEYPQQLAQYVGKKNIATQAIKDKRWDHCMICGAHRPKKEMVTLSARSGRGTRNTTMGFMCHECLRGFCAEHNIPVPNVEGMNNG